VTAAARAAGAGGLAAVARAGGPAAAAAGVAALAAVPLVAPGYVVDLLTELLIWALLALSLDLMFGHATLYSFGHAAFFGTGAYAAALTVHHGLGGLWTGVAAAIAASLLVGLVVGGFAARSGGVVFIVLTVLLSHVLFTLAHVLTGLTGGENGIYLFARLVLWGQTGVRDGAPFYWLVLAITVAALVLARRLVASPFGHVLLAIRENEDRARAMGYSTAAFKLTITLVAAALAGLAGALNVFMNRFVSPETLGLGLSTQVVIWTLLGGMGTLVGPMLGAAGLVLLTDTLNRLVPGYVIVLGVLFILVVIFLPGGAIRLLPAFREPAAASSPEHPRAPRRSPREARPS
jgi:branched-chain amino acid transport system permease protein